MATSPPVQPAFKFIYGYVHDNRDKEKSDPCNAIPQCTCYDYICLLQLMVNPRISLPHNVGLQVLGHFITMVITVDARLYYYATCLGGLTARLGRDILKHPFS